MTTRNQQPTRKKPTRPTKKRLKMSKTFDKDYLVTLKFNILDRLQRKDEVYRNKVFCLVMEQTQRNESTIRRLIHRKRGEDKAADFHILHAFAGIFKVPIEDLTNPSAELPKA